jgi:hypothetical protein
MYKNPDGKVAAYGINGGNPYPIVDDICTAAAHNGLIKPGVAKLVTIKTREHPVAGLYPNVPGKYELYPGLSSGNSDLANAGNMGYLITTTGATIAEDRWYILKLLGDTDDVQTVLSRADMVLLNRNVDHARDVTQRGRAMLNKIMTDDYTNSMLNSMMNFQYKTDIINFKDLVGKCEKVVANLQSSIDKIGNPPQLLTPNVQTVDDALKIRAYLERYRSVSSDITTPSSDVSALERMLNDIPKIFDERKKYMCPIVPHNAFFHPLTGEMISGSVGCDAAMSDQKCINACSIMPDKTLCYSYDSSTNTVSKCNRRTEELNISPEKYLTYGL